MYQVGHCLSLRSSHFARHKTHFECRIADLWIILSTEGHGISVATANFVVVPETASADAKLLKRVAWIKYT